MTIRLPAHFRARPMADEARVALSRRNNQKPRDGVHSISQTLPPLKDPIDGDSHTLRQRRFSARMYVNKVDGAGASRRENAKIIALGKSGLNVPSVFVLASSPLEMSALALNRGFSGTFGIR